MAFKKLLQKWHSSHNNKVWERAKEIYQVCEYDGELWITVHGALCTPQSMLNADIIQCVEKLRLRYLNSHKVGEL